MTANQFYVPLIAGDATLIVLSGEEHRHLARAARVRAGEEVWLIDAHGRRCLTRVEKVGDDRTEVVVLAMEGPETPRTRIALAPCLMEAKKLETVIEKAAELGCAEVIPVVSARSLKDSGERTDRKLERWKRIVREAAKQCKAPLLTEVHPPRPLKELLRDPGADRRLFLSEHGGRPLRDIVTAGSRRRGSRRLRSSSSSGPRAAGRKGRRAASGRPGSRPCPSAAASSGRRPRPSRERP